MALGRGPGKLAEITGVGTVLAGKYRIERVVGSGGMGAVALAQHLRLGSRVAVKFMLPRHSDVVRPAARLLREARTASQITSVHVARVFDVDLREDGVPYIVMEYLEGETLSATIRREGKLGVKDAIDDVLATGEALAEAHALGIVHRDLKPANLFRARAAGRGAHVLKVLDFGISKTFGSSPDEPATVTTDGTFLGSPPYMSPEQLTLPGQVDWRTDIWSLGVVLYECLTGVSPFAAPTIPATCARVLQGAPPAPSSVRPDLPPDLDRPVLRCLAASPADRYQSVHELARDLAPFGSLAAERSLASIASLSELPATRTADVTGPPPPLTTVSASDESSSLAGVMRPFLKMPRTLGLGGAAVLLVVAGLLVSLRWSRDEGGRVPTAARSSHPAEAVETAPTAPPVAPPEEKPVEPTRAASPATVAARALPRGPGPKSPPRAAMMPRARPSSASPAPPSSATISAPAAPVATIDPESIYTDRK